MTVGALRRCPLEPFAFVDDLADWFASTAEATPTGVAIGVGADAFEIVVFDSLGGGALARIKYHGVPATAPALRSLHDELFSLLGVRWALRIV